MLWGTILVSCEPRAMNLVKPDLSGCENAQNDVRRNVRIVSYNIRSAQSSSIETLREILQQLEPDIVALQEVDRDTARSGFIDQAAKLADALGMEYAYAATRMEGAGDYGIALLSRLPFRDVSRVELPENLSWEPRVALHSSLCIGSGTLDLYNLHADIWPWSSSAQIQYLQKRIASGGHLPVVVLGDFNATIAQSGPSAFRTEAWDDVMSRIADAPTYTGLPFPARIDHIFASAELSARIQDAGVYRSAASDHFPIWVDLEL